MADLSAVKVDDTNLVLVIPSLKKGRDPERLGTKVVRVNKETIVCSVTGRQTNEVFDRETGIASAGAEHGHLEFATV